jgi:hypothetical protein
VLLPARRHENVLTVEAADDELHGTDVGRMIDRAMREDDANYPLLERYQQPKASGGR